MLHCLVLSHYLFCRYRLITYQFGFFQVLVVHIYCGDLVIVVGSVVVNALVEITTRGVYRYFILAVSHFATASLLVNAAECSTSLDNCGQRQFDCC